MKALLAHPSGTSGGTLDSSIPRLSKEEAFTAFWGSFRASTVVDAGCGDGVNLKFLLAQVSGWKAAYGADPSPQAIEAASAHFSGDPRVTFLQAPAEKLPLETGSADLFIFAHSVHHIARPDLALAEARRVLCPGGALAITEQVEEGLDPLQEIWQEYHALRGELEHASGAFMRPIYRASELRALATEAGFRPVREMLGVEEALPPSSADALDEQLKKLISDLPLTRAGLSDALERHREAVIARIRGSGYRRPPELLAEWRRP